MYELLGNLLRNLCCYIACCRCCPDEDKKEEKNKATYNITFRTIRALRLLYADL